MSSEERPTVLPQRARNGADPAGLSDAFAPLAPIWSPRTPKARPTVPAAVAPAAEAPAAEPGPSLTALPTRASQGSDAPALPDGFGQLTPLGLLTPRQPLPSTPPAGSRDRRASRPRPRPGGTVPRSRLAHSSAPRSAPAAGTLWSPDPEPPSVPEALPEEVPAVAPGGVRRTRIVLIGAVVCALLVLGGAAVLLRPGADPRGAGSAALADGEVPSASDYEPPVTLPLDAERVETDVLEGGDLLVTHWINTSEPMDRLELNVPISQGLDDPRIAVSQLVVAADGVQVDLASTVVSGADGAGALPAASTLYVQYRLSGAVQGSDSAEGRALATVTSLDVVVGSRALSRTQAFPGAEVLTLACLAPGAQSIPQPCGQFEGGTWAVESAADDVPDTVIAQLDLAVER